MKLEIVKAHGTANDFVMVEDLDGTLALGADLVRRLCDRRRGVGADGLIRVAPGKAAEIFMDYRNADGSVAEMCGNGVRCIAKYCFDRGILTGSTAEIETRAGNRRVVPHMGAGGKVARVEVDMGPAYLRPDEVPVDAEGESALDLLLDVLGGEGEPLRCAAVGMGNPHAVLFCADVEAAPVASLGPRVEHSTAFPQGANVEFVRVVSSARLDMRVWERGVGETLACGTGACAAVVAAHELGLADARCEVAVRGGLLHVTYGETVTLTGPAVEVFTGIVDTLAL